MGLFDTLTGMAGNLLGDSDDPKAAMLRSVLGAVQHHEGGLPGMLEQLRAGGLGEAVSSWIGSGQNLPVSSEQISSILGSGQVAALAGKIGIAPETLNAHLSEILPQVVDRLTPNGQAGAGSFDPAAIAGALRGMLGK